MKHEQTPLASSEGFGGISNCSCGQYHLHLPGVSVHLNEKGFENLVQMVFEAKQKLELSRLDNDRSSKNHMRLVKK